MAKAAIVAIAGAAAIAGLTLAWPGVALYDTTIQYAQVMSGRYDDWHPPIMARFWAEIEAIGLHGTGPLLVAQLALFWGGIALTGTALAKAGAPRAGVALALAMLFPVIVDWSIAVDKDMQLIAVMVAATGIVAWFRLADRRVPGWAAGVVAALLGYAVLVRANAAFAVVPLAWGLCGWGARRFVPRAAILLGTTLVVLALLSPVNRRLLGASASHVERTLPVFDLAGIAHYAPLATVPGVSPALWRAGERRHCYTPFFWDSFGDSTTCGQIGDILTNDDNGRTSLFRNWLLAIARHPLAYAEHRAMHLNANLRFLVPADEPSTAVPPESEPNPWRIGAAANAATQAMEAVTTATCRTPLGAPIVWLAAALTLWWTLAATPLQPARGTGLALAVSACLMAASFAVVSIASDLRYHLWLFVATLLAAAMTGACRGVPRRRLAIGGGATLAIALAAGAARLMLTALPM